jgi:hypothetical protein
MSNYSNFGVTSREDLKQYILNFLGYPLIQVEITDQQLDFAIDTAIEQFTKFADQDEDYLVLPIEDYQEGEGIILPHNVTSCFSLDSMFESGGRGQPYNTLFSLDAQFRNSMFDMGIFQGGIRGGFVGWHLFHEKIELFKRMLGQRFTFNWNVRSKLLKLIPDPTQLKLTGFLIIGCYIIRDDTFQYGEDLVKRLALAYTKMIVGEVRKKFQGTTLLGGGSLNTEIYAEGLAERDAVLEQIQAVEGPVNNFLIA